MPPTTAQETIQRIPIDRIDPSPTNPRKTFDEKGIKTLAGSISQQGIHSPLVIREIGKRYQLVFGERRWKASKIAKPNPPFWTGKDVPAVIRKYTDEQVREIQLTENLQREDLHPIEEAEAYEEMLKDPTYTIEKLAMRTAKPLKDIKKRLRLLKLITPLRKLFLSGDIGWDQAFEFCRVLPETQAAMLERFNDDIPRAKDLAELIAEKVFLDLSIAAFPLDDATLVLKAGACKDCPKRTGAEPALFEDIAKGDKCLDRLCFQTKTQAFIQIQLKPQEGKPALIPISTGQFLSDGEKKKLPAGTLTREDNFDLVKKDECTRAEAALVVHGDGFGKVKHICRAADCKEHGGRHKSNYSGTGENPQEREKRLRKERQEKAMKEARRAILKAIGDKHVESSKAEMGHAVFQQIGRAIFSRLYNELQRKMLNVLGYMRERKSGETWDDIFAAGFEPLKANARDRVLIMLSLATYIDGKPHGVEEDALMNIASQYGIKVSKIEEEVNAKYDQHKPDPPAKPAKDDPKPKAKGKKAAAAK